MMETSEDRRTYDNLCAQSDEEYRLAGVAMRAGDYDGYKCHTDRSWALADEAQPFKERLPATEQDEIRGSALLAMATGFVRGLGRSS